jgi:hypothetical protein
VCVCVSVRVFAIHACLSPARHPSSHRQQHAQPPQAMHAPFLPQEYQDFFVGGMDDNSVWSASMWNRMLSWARHGPPPAPLPPVGEALLSSNCTHTHTHTHTQRERERERERERQHTHSLTHSLTHSPTHSLTPDCRRERAGLARASTAPAAFRAHPASQAAAAPGQA